MRNVIISYVSELNLHFYPAAFKFLVALCLRFPTMRFHSDHKNVIYYDNKHVAIKRNSIKDGKIFCCLLGCFCCFSSTHNRQLSFAATCLLISFSMYVFTLRRFIIQMNFINYYSLHWHFSWNDDDAHSTPWNIQTILYPRNWGEVNSSRIFSPFH